METFGAAGYPKSVRLPLAMCGLFPAVQKVPPPMYPPRVEPCMPATLILKHPFKGSKNTEKKQSTNAENKLFSVFVDSARQKTFLLAPPVHVKPRLMTQPNSWLKGGGCSNRRTRPRQGGWRTAQRGNFGCNVHKRHRKDHPKYKPTYKTINGTSIWLSILEWVNAS